jgi:hypothetical protein
MSTGSDALGKESQLQEELTRLRAENRRLLAELERLATGDRGPGSGPVAADPLAADSLLDSPGVADGDQAALAAAAVVRSPLLAGASNWSDPTTHLDSADPGSAMYVIGNGRGVSGVAQGPGLHGFSYTQNGVVGQGVANRLNGVQGQAGVGVYASGEHAALQLGRNSLSGAPTAGFHTVGELVLDANADPYLCKASGTPGTWKLLG